MYICQVLASRGNGGLEKHVRDLSIALVAEGHRVLVIADPIFLATLPDQIEKKALNMRYGRYHPWLLFQLWKALKSYPIDVIHAQANKAAYLVNSVAWALKIPCVATLHSIKKDVAVFSHFQQVICVSKYLSSLVKSAHVEVIYNGISLTSNDVTTPKEQMPIDGKPVICAVGRLEAVKGFDLLIDAVDGLNLKLIIAGDGKLRQSLERRVLRMHALTEVDLMGHCEDVASLMKACDGVIIPSRREGFSYVFVEALLNHCNIISTDVPVANEVLPSSLIVPINDPMALRHKIETYVFDSNAWKTQMSSAHAMAKTYFTITQMVSKTITVYQKMIEYRSV